MTIDFTGFFEYDNWVKTLRNERDIVTEEKLKYDMENEIGQQGNGGSLGTGGQDSDTSGASGKNKLLPVVIGLAAVLVLVIGFFTIHFWSEGSCTEAPVCKLCGAVQGNPDGHRWTAAGCVSARKCTICGETDGTALGHQWKEATCENPKTCVNCGEEYGFAMGHQWTVADCENPMTCQVCAAVDGEAAGHQWQAATLHAPKNCQICGATEGDQVKLISLALDPAQRDVMMGILSDGRVIQSAGGEFLWKFRENVSSAAIGNGFEIVSRTDGTAMARGDNEHDQCEVGSWTDIVSVYAGDGYTLGLRADGTIFAAGRIYTDCRDIHNWTDIVALSVWGNAVVGVKADGSAVSVGFPAGIAQQISTWTDLKKVDVYYDSTYSLVAGLKNDGTVVYFCNHPDGFDAGAFTGVRDISVSNNMLIVLNEIGTISGAGSFYQYVAEYVADWQNIEAIETADSLIVGICSDGSIRAIGADRYDAIEAINVWNEMIWAGGAR